MILTLWLVFVLWAFKYYRPTKRKTQKRKAAQSLACQPSQAEARRREKDEQERQLAAADLDRLQAERQTYIRLLDAVTAELDQTGNQKRIVSLLSKQASIESKLHTLDRRIDRAYMTARS